MIRSTAIHIALCLVLALGLALGGTAHAQTVTTYAVPAGYQLYSNGIYYNPSVGTYFNSFTGTFSSQLPSTTMTIPPGFGYWGGGYYYNVNTSQYYNPSTGVYSTSIPGTNVGTVVTGGTPGTIFNIPAGYTAMGNGLYYNASTGLYFCPTTGSFSSAGITCPASSYTGTTYYPPTTSYGTSYSGPVYSTVGSYSAYSYNPGFPNTGTNTSKRNFDIALASVAVVLGGVLLMIRARKNTPVYQR